MIHSMAICNNCEGTFQHEDGVDETVLLEEGWLIVKEGLDEEESGPKENFDFCSFRCLALWAKARTEITA